jgi:hypothetical protein
MSVRISFDVSAACWAERVQAFHHFLWWWRDKCCVARPRASDPVLGFTEFTWTLLTAASLGQENLVNFSYQPQRENSLANILSRQSPVARKNEAASRAPGVFLAVETLEVHTQQDFDCKGQNMIASLPLRVTRHNSISRFDVK